MRSNGGRHLACYEPTADQNHWFFTGVLRITRGDSFFRRICGVLTSKIATHLVDFKLFAIIYFLHCV